MEAFVNARVLVESIQKAEIETEKIINHLNPLENLRDFFLSNNQKKIKKIFAIFNFYVKIYAIFFL